MKPYIRPLRAADYKQWKSLFLDYSPEWKMSDRHLKRTWKLMMDPKSVLFGWVASKGKGSPSGGFIHCVIYPSTCRGIPICYVHDLYVAPDCRRQGLARAMLEHIKATGKRKKWRYIYWKTDTHNINAQKLYDGIVKRTNRIYYELRF